MKKTVTSIFMVPTLKVPSGGFKENGFINAYSKDSRKEIQYEDAIYALFRPENTAKFMEFLDSEYERCSDNIIEDYDYEDGFVVIVYKLNSFFKEDFDIIRKGLYSQTSTLFQNEFPKEIVIKKYREEVPIVEKSLQFRIFKKSLEMRIYWEEKLHYDFDEEMEVWYTFDEEKETLNLDVIKKELGININV